MRDFWGEVEDRGARDPQWFADLRATEEYLRVQGAQTAKGKEMEVAWPPICECPPCPCGARAGQNHHYYRDPHSDETPDCPVIGCYPYGNRVPKGLWQHKHQDGCPVSFPRCVNCGSPNSSHRVVFPWWCVPCAEKAERLATAHWSKWVNETTLWMCWAQFNDVLDMPIAPQHVGTRAALARNEFVVEQAMRSGDVKTADRKAAQRPFIHID